ncbi:methyl-accepting chemotaxis protein [Desulfocurvibacter africanus]|uniref:Methyl-accepting chemotaxis sensory transducer n=1 Tax=Desulfocurvibacter africanus subsp. africanus str. Walvis Bay TaxID=690850 RepID=F3Z209_DESAF|nr:methyl-accepting chemotaxis protein [Desulfocurvibacter africanus]EGJ50117.1 methyl-accepting chemotaxis sensory transducer [Desulfocurvibacter africanus subsp. africanus str. Walvis Bay]
MRIQAQNISTVVLSIVSLAIVTAVAAMVMYVGKTSYELALQLQMQSMEHSVHSVSDALSWQMAEHKDLAATLASQAAIREALQTGNPARATERLESYMRSYGDSIWSMLALDRNGVVLAGFDQNMRSLAGQNLSDKDYVRAALGSHEPQISRSVFREGEQLVFAVAAPVRGATGEIVGCVAFLPLWNRFTETMLDPIRFGERGYGFILDTTGVLIAHAADKNLILKDISQNDFVRQALRSKDTDIEYEWQGEDKFLSSRHEPVSGWVVCMSAYTSELTATAKHQTLALLGIGVAIIACLIGLLALVMRSTVTRPVQAIEDFTKRIAQGDFKAKLDGTFKYEFSALSGNVAAMVAELKNKLGMSQGLMHGMTVPCLVVDTNEHITFINQPCLDMLQLDGPPERHLGKIMAQVFYKDATRSTLVGKCMKTGETIRNQEIQVTGHKGGLVHAFTNIASLTDLDGRIIGGFCIYVDLSKSKEQEVLIRQQNESMARVAQEADLISERVSSASEELSAQVEQSSQGAAEQQSRTGEAATAMEQMNSSVLEVARNASGVADLAERTKGMAKDGETVVASVVQVIGRINSKATELKGDMTKLGEQAQGIGQILGVISDIADQTNLLALNAAIEAARAGEAGRGFAVVADEVRKLAEKTMNATRDVENSIKSIQDSVRKSVANTDATTSAIQESTELAGRSGQALKGIVTMVEQTADQVRGIATASEEQSAASEQINRSIEEISRISSETSDAMNQSAQAVTDLARLAQELKGIIEQMRQ